MQTQSSTMMKFIKFSNLMMNKEMRWKERERDKVQVEKKL
jgi:hypothetical protein